MASKAIIIFNISPIINMKIIPPNKVRNMIVSYDEAAVTLIALEYQKAPNDSYQIRNRFHRFINHRCLVNDLLS